MIKEKTYKLRLTSKQMWIIQSHIYDLCNYSFNKNFTDQDFKCMDSHDMYRIKIYNKEKKVGKSFIFNLTEQEANFIKSEIDYFVFNSHGEPEKDRYYYSERQISKRIINKIDKLFDISEQRDIKLKEILGF